jgi:hypothetical protein
MICHFDGHPYSLPITPKRRSTLSKVSLLFFVVKVGTKPVDLKKKVIFCFKSQRALQNRVMLREFRKWMKHEFRKQSPYLNAKEVLDVKPIYFCKAKYLFHKSKRRHLQTSKLQWVRKLCV